MSGANPNHPMTQQSPSTSSTSTLGFIPHHHHPHLSIFQNMSTSSNQQMGLGGSPSSSPSSQLAHAQSLINQFIASSYHSLIQQQHHTNTTEKPSSYFGSALNNLPFKILPSLPLFSPSAAMGSSATNGGIAVNIKKHETTRGDEKMTLSSSCRSVDAGEVSNIEMEKSLIYQ